MSYEQCPRCAMPLNQYGDCDWCAVEEEDEEEEMCPRCGGVLPGAVTEQRAVCLCPHCGARVCEGGV